MSALLEVNALSKRFGGVQAVADLSFTVGQGEILSLIGPNGAGKSTVFNLINGVSAPDSGRIVFEGRDITGKPTYEIAHRGIARAHQIVQPLAGLSVLDNCLVGACYGRDNLSMAAGRKVVREIAELVGLADRLEMPAGAAHHRRQEAARAGARALRPPAPVAARRGAGRPQPQRRSVHGRDDHRIRARGIAILMVEHVMTAIMTLSDRIVVLNRRPQARGRLPAGDRQRSGGRSRPIWAIPS